MNEDEVALNIIYWQVRNMFLDSLGFLLPGLSFLLCSSVVCSLVVLSFSFCKFIY